MKMKFKRLISLVLMFVFCTGCALAYENLPSGSKGEMVEQMQARLKALGFYEKSIDGDYGKQTKSALKAFQLVNGLEETGEATADVLEFLYSDKAKSAPLPPDVEVTAVKYNQRSGQVKITIRNNCEETISSVKLSYLALNSNGDVKCQYSSFDYLSEELFGKSTIIDRKIQVGKTTSISGYLVDGVPTIAVGMSEYQTASGNKVLLSKEQITYLRSDGQIIYPTRDPQEYTMLSNSDYESARQIMFGFTYIFIPVFAETQYMLPSGYYVSTVDQKSMADEAGLIAGDVVTEIAGVSTSEPYCAELAKLKMLDGETVTLTYWRNNQSHDTQLSLNMEKPIEEESAQPTHSIVDELLKYASLLEKGLITQEEYDLFKQKLLSE